MQAGTTVSLLFSVVDIGIIARKLQIGRDSQLLVLHVLQNFRNDLPNFFQEFCYCVLCWGRVEGGLGNPEIFLQVLEGLPGNGDQCPFVTIKFQSLLGNILLLVCGTSIGPVIILI